MIPTPNLAYLAILPAVDNLATPHGEFSAIRLYIIFRRFIFLDGSIFREHADISRFVIEGELCFVILGR